MTNGDKRSQTTTLFGINRKSPEGKNNKEEKERTFFQNYSQLDKESLKEINMENLKKNPLLFAAKNESNQKETVNPFILEKLRRMTLANSISNPDGSEKKNKKVNFLKFLKKRDNKTDATTRKSVLHGFIKEIGMDDINNMKKGID